MASREREGTRKGKRVSERVISYERVRSGRGIACDFVSSFFFISFVYLFYLFIYLFVFFYMIMYFVPHIRVRYIYIYTFEYLCVIGRQDYEWCMGEKTREKDVK